MYNPILIQELDSKARQTAHESTLKLYPNDYRVEMFDVISGSKEALAHYNKIQKEALERMIIIIT